LGFLRMIIIKQTRQAHKALASIEKPAQFENTNKATKEHK